NKNECVLVVTQDGQVLDYTLYQLGLRDYSEYKELVRAVVEEKESNVEAKDATFTYSDLMNIEMKVIVGADTYQKDDTYDVWVDKSEDKEFMENVIENKSETMKIVGIVSPKEGENSAVLTPGAIYYTNDIVLDTIEKASKTEIVKEQLANKDKDVFSGKDFSESSSASNFDTSQLISIDEGAISAAFKFDTSSLNLSLSSISANFSADDIGSSLPAIDQDKLNEILSGSGTSPLSQEGIYAFASALLNDYVAKEGQYDSPDAYLMSPDAAIIFQTYIPGMVNPDFATSISSALTEYMSSYMEEAMTAVSKTLTAKMQASMQQVSTQLTYSLANAISVDQEALKNAFKLNMSTDELQGAILAMISGSDTSSADTNLQTLGYADLSVPTAIDIYAKDFDTKQAVKDALDDYSTKMKNEGNDDKVVSYTDLVGVMMSGVRTIINVISYLLIAFVSISLVVSSIMIGIITYVSVLERTKEIGILRSIGASRKNISQVFNAETIIEGLIAGVMGIVVTALLCIPASAIVKMLTGVNNIASLPLNAAIILIAISVFLTFIAGLIPAASASRKDPVIALRSE
ncbi:MAG: ABC transporter permease, partial [Phoenicibacter congonensis]|nr:ABC transporter permease [Phoenicibacter congonensis]